MAGRPQGRKTTACPKGGKDGKEISHRKGEESAEIQITPLQSL